MRMRNQHERNVKKDIYTNINKTFQKNSVQFIHLNLDPDPATQINVDPCGSGSETPVKCTIGRYVHNVNHFQKCGSMMVFFLRWWLNNSIPVTNHCLGMMQVWLSPLTKTWWERWSWDYRWDGDGYSPLLSRHAERCGLVLFLILTSWMR